MTKSPEKSVFSYQKKKVQESHSITQKLYVKYMNIYFTFQHFNLERAISIESIKPKTLLHSNKILKQNWECSNHLTHLTDENHTLLFTYASRKITWCPKFLNPPWVFLLIILFIQGHHEWSFVEANHQNPIQNLEWSTMWWPGSQYVVEIVISLFLPGTRPCIRCQKWQRTLLQPGVKSHENNETLK